MKKLLLRPIFIALLFLSAIATGAFAADGPIPLKTKKAKYADGDNADLRNLYTSDGWVWPVVTKDVTETNLITYSYLEQLSLTPVLQDPNAHAVISYQSPDGGISVHHNTPSAPFAIEKFVASKFYIKVTSANGLVKKTYIVNLPVLHTITNIEVGTGGSAPAFDPANFNYHIDVPPDRSSLQVLISSLQNTRWVLEGHKMSPLTSSYSLLWTASQLDLGDNFYTLRTYPLNGPLTADRVLETYHFTIRRSPPLTVSATHTDIAGENDPVNYTGRPGTATAVPNGGTAPYTYSWFNVSTNTALSQTTAAVDGLNGYKYKVTVTDFYGATNTTSVTIKQTVPFILILPTCPDLNNGIFEPGGLPGVRFNINGEGLYVSGTTPAKLTNIPSSWVYGVTVGTEYYELYPPTKQSVTIELFRKKDVTTYGGNDGGIFVDPKYADGNYAFTTLAWVDLSTNTQIAVTEATNHWVVGLKAGTYRVISTAPDICPVSLDITITQPKSTNANLSNLVVSSGTLSPVFSAGVTAYTTQITGIQNVTLTPTLADTSARISYNGTAYANGAAIPVTLVSDSNRIAITVTAQNGSTKDYTVDIIRRAAAPSANANLSSLAISNGTLTPVFSTNVNNYAVNVPFSTTTIILTPTVADTGAIVKVNTVTVASGIATAPIALVTGSNTITIDVKAGDGTIKTYTVAVTRYNGAPTITFNPTQTIAYGSGDFAPTYTSSSTGAITYTSDNDAVATIVDGKIRIVAPGTANITISQAADGEYGEATSVQLLTVAKAAQTITFATLPVKTVGDGAFTLAATSSTANTITFTSSNTNVATISGDTVTIVGSGTSTITASQSGDDNYAEALPVTQTLTVFDGPPVLLSATYNGATGLFTVTGKNMISGNGIDFSKMTLTGEGGNTFNLTTYNIEYNPIVNGTSFSFKTTGLYQKVYVNSLFGKNGDTASSGQAYNIAFGEGWENDQTSPADLITPLTVSNAKLPPAITGVTYDVANQSFRVSGANLVDMEFVPDININKITLTGDNGATYKLTSFGVEMDGYGFTDTLNYNVQVRNLFNKNGNTSLTSNTPYKLSAAANWNIFAAASETTNFTVINAPPVMASAAYNNATGVLDIAGANFTNTGAGIFNPTYLKIKGQGGIAYTLTSSQVSTTNAELFSITLNDADKSALKNILNGNGVNAKDGTIYNITSANGWSVNVATVFNDAAGKSLTVSGIANANLSNLAISSGTLSPVFAADTLNYSATVSTAVNNLTITPTFADTTATITYNGQTYKAGAAISVALLPGNNSIPLLVTAGAGNTKTYTLTVTREASLPVNLSLSYTISPASTLIKVTGPANYNYATSVAANINSITITPKPADINAVVKVEGLIVASGATSAPITLLTGTTTIVHMQVTAPSGANKTYTIAVSKNGSSNTKLSFALTPASTLVKTTGPATYNYTTSVAPETGSITITPKAADPTAVVRVEGDVVAYGEPSLPLTLLADTTIMHMQVTAPSGDIKTYAVTVIRNGSSNTNLSFTLTPASTLIKTTGPANVSYITSVAHGTGSVTITPKANDPAAVVRVEGDVVAYGAPSLPFTLLTDTTIVHMEITAPSGAIKTYAVTVIRNGSSNTNLSFALTPASTLVKTTGPANYNYTTSVAPETGSIIITPKAADPAAVVRVAGDIVAYGASSAPITLLPGVTAVQMDITAPSGVSRTYAIAVSRNGSSNTQLSFAITPASTLTKVTGPANYNYTTSVAPETGSITITPKAYDPAAVVRVESIIVAYGASSPPLTLLSGTTTIQMEVTSPSGAIRTYQIAVSRKGSSNTKLSFKLTPSSTLTTVTGPANYNYTTSVAPETGSITITPKSTDPAAVVRVKDDIVASGTPSAPITLSTGANVISMNITAVDGTVKTYEFTVNRPAMLVVSRVSNFSLLPEGNKDSRAIVEPRDTWAELDAHKADVVVHQALSPNGDGVNDVLTIDGLSSYPVNNLSVINANGALIYQTAAYGTKGNVFDGHSSNRTLLQPGTYYYILEYKDGSTSKRKTGYIVVKY